MILNQFETILFAMLILNQLFKFLKLLHSETGHHQMAGGVVLGMFMGLTPMLTLSQVFYLLVLLCVRINFGAAFIAMALFKGLAFACDPFLDRLGSLALRNDSAEPIWTALYNMPVVPYTFFYNTVVMGSILTSLALSIPVFLLSGFLIDRYRTVVVAKFKGTWLFRAWMSSKLYPLYVKYSEITDL